MALLLQSDLSSANSSKMISLLTSDMEDSKKLIASLEDFSSSSTSVLVGASFDAVRSHLQGYIDALNTRVKVAESLISSLKAANDAMSDYMDGEAKLDSSELETLQNEANHYKSQAQSYFSRIDNYDSEKESMSKQALYDAYYGAREEQRRREKIIKLINDLEAQDSATFATLSSVTDEISQFSDSVGGISTIRI